MLKIVLVATFTLGMAGAAFAEAPINASLNTAVAKPAEILAGDTLWEKILLRQGGKTARLANFPRDVDAN